MTDLTGKNFTINVPEDTAKSGDIVFKVTKPHEKARQSKFRSFCIQISNSTKAINLGDNKLVYEGDLIEMLWQHGMSTTIPVIINWGSTVHSATRKAIFYYINYILRIQDDEMINISL